MQKAVSDIYITTDGDPAKVEDLKAQYLRRCPLHALFKNSGCAMVENWRIEHNR